ncbi:MAG: DUF5050 domain-containing protein [Bacteroidota bacterium]
MKVKIAALALFVFYVFSGCENNVISPLPSYIEKMVFVSMPDLADASYNSYSNIFSINLDGSNLKQLTYGQNYSSFYPIISHDSRKIIFESTRDGIVKIYSMNIDGSNITPLTNDPTINNYPQISGDDSFIVFQRGGNNLNGHFIRTQICRINLDGSNLITLSDTSRYAQNPMINTIYKKIYFTQIINGNSILFSVDYDGSNLEALTDSTIGFSNEMNDYSISHDGSKIAFIDLPNYSTKTDLCIMNADGSGIRKLTQDSNMEARPVFTIDDSQIVYDVSGHSSEDKIMPIKIISVAGGTPKDLIEMVRASNPVVNLRGDKILFTAVNNGHFDIYSMDFNGKNLINITNNDQDDFSPCIVP